MSDFTEIMREAVVVEYAATRAVDVPHSRGQRVKCTRCDELVVVTPTYLAQRRREARQAGHELVVVCHDCIGSENPDAPVVAVMPGDDAFAQAEEFRV